MPEIVIIGGSYAGLNAVSVVAKNDPSASITLISPSSHAYFNIAAPRLLAQPELWPKCVFPVADMVQENSHGRASFVLGSATNVDPDSRTVTYVDASGESATVPYDFLVIASGSGTHWDGFKTNLDHQLAHKCILDASSTLKSSKRVAIIGGGPTGVETAGEIADAFPAVDVHLFSGPAPLAEVSPSLAASATQKLEALGVNVIPDVYVKRAGAVGDKHKLEATKGTNLACDLEYDLVLECFLAKPYSGFLPDSFKDEKGYVVTDNSLLVKGHANIAALGDIVSGGGLTIVDIKMRQLALFTKAFRAWLNGGSEPACWFQWPRFMSRSSSLGLDTAFGPPLNKTCIVPISRNGGVGLLFGYSVPNFLVVLVKAKSFMINTARSLFGP